MEYLIALIVILLMINMILDHKRNR